MNATPCQDPSRSAFRPIAPVPLTFDDTRVAEPGPPRPPNLVPDDLLGRQRLRLLDTLDQITLAEYERTLDVQCDALARVILDAYGEWAEAGKPPSAQRLPEAPEAT